MRPVKLLDRYDRDIIIDIDRQPTVYGKKQLLQAFDDWMNSRVSWGRPFLIIAGAITFVSILTMILKHV